MSESAAYAAMLAGATYNCLDPELLAIRAEAQALCWRFNHEPDPGARAAILHMALGELAADALIEAPFTWTYGRHIALGPRSFINTGCTIIDNNWVRIGAQVMIGPQVQIYTAAHALRAEERLRGDEQALPVSIADRAWIGGGAIILPGVAIGVEAVVGAGAVVTRDVPARVVVAGNPARVIKRLDEA